MTLSIDHSVALTRRKYGGIAAIAGALLAIAGNTALLFVTPVVTDQFLSYPVTPAQFRWVQVFFALTQALMAYGVFALVSSSTGRRSLRVFAALSVIGFAITVPGELVLILVADKTFDDAATNAASAVFGIGLLIADLGMIGYGIASRRNQGWSVLPLIFGAFQLLVVTPAIFATGFTSFTTYVAIAVADLLIAAIGVRLLTTE
ncbi:hypothetical protein GCM10009630_50380 [Kribbella jejuensis]|uniref:DUF4386 family protein n=1 Tax=Kribbella jejuensis TaxID=236068 RepID=A0A542E7V4_9ACTN|nr:hypothetical protein [Kribbella jejuensis]TQJ11421.1 hypothetical protein FB475_4335 [Kribbella jejuensis]